MATQPAPFPALAKTTVLMALILYGSGLQAGGWATAVLEQLPEFALRDKLLDVTFTVKQHGVEPLTNLKVHIVARSIVTGEKRDFRVREVSHGLYTGELNFPSTGMWNWEIKTGWPGPTAMPQIEVLDSADGQARETTDYRKGARLFVAKGCITCHRNARAGLAKLRSLQIGLDLTNYSASTTFLQRWLTDPRNVKPESRMPDPNLSEDDITALTSFLQPVNFRGYM